MREQILKSIQQMIQAILSAPVVIGAVPPDGGYAVSFAGDSNMETFWNLATNEDLPVAFYGKGADQQALVSSMSAVHDALTRAFALPYTEDWQIYAIETMAAPQPVGEETNQNWLYGSSLRVKFFMKG